MDMFGLVAEAAEADSGGQLPDVAPADNKQILEWEKEFLGLYLSSHPLTSIVGNGVPDGYVQIVDIAERPVNDKVKIIGMVTGVRRITTRKNTTMAIVEIEDLTGTVESVAFPDTFEQCSTQLEPDAILTVTGKVDERGESRQIIIESISSSLPELNLRPHSTPSVFITLPRKGDYWADVAVMQEVDDVLKRHEGEARVVLLVPSDHGYRRLRSRTRQVTWSQELVEALEGIVGRGRVALERDGEPVPMPNRAQETFAVA